MTTVLSGDQRAPCWEAGNVTNTTIIHKWPNLTERTNTQDYVFTHLAGDFGEEACRYVRGGHNEI